MSVVLIAGIRIVVINATVLVKHIISPVNRNVREDVCALKIMQNLDHWAFVCRLYHRFVDGIVFGEKIPNNI